jgi:formylglycine-generating enzyme
VRIPRSALLLSIAIILPASLRAQALTIEMIEVEGGRFLMGSPESERGRMGDEARHEVSISSFLIGKYEVTQNQYLAAMGQNPSNMKGAEVAAVRKLDPDQADLGARVAPGELPVERVSWYDAVRFCNALAVAQKLQPAYRIEGTTVKWDRSANGYRLPTEAEWEYAARGGAAGSGRVFSGSDEILEVGWTNIECENGTQPLGQRVVGLKKPNELGLYDMSGNVWEWCWDWYGPYPAGPVGDPAGPDSGPGKVARGGAWNLPVMLARVACRSPYGMKVDPNDKAGHRGLRLARNK